MTEEELVATHSHPGADTTTATGATSMTAPRSKSATASASADSIALRSLVNTRDAGVIIGRNGSHVQEIREQVGVSIRLSEYVPTHQERVLTVYGAVDGIGKVRSGGVVPVGC